MYSWRWGGGGPCEGRKLGLDGNKRNATGKGGGPGLLVIIAVGGGDRARGAPRSGQEVRREGGPLGEEQQKEGSSLGGAGPQPVPFPLEEGGNSVSQWFGHLVFQHAGAFACFRVRLVYVPSGVFEVQNKRPDKGTLCSAALSSIPLPGQSQESAFLMAFTADSTEGPTLASSCVFPGSLPRLLKTSSPAELVSFF